MSVWAQTMLLWSWQSLLMVGFVLAVVRIARYQSAASRHSFWLLAVLVIAVLPAVNAIVRALPVAAPAVASIPYVTQLSTVAIEALPTAVHPSSPARDFITPSLFGFWIAGVLISAVRSFRTDRRWRRIVRSAGSVDKTGFPVPVGFSREVEAPVLVGTLRPMIVLPADIETWTNAEERSAVLLHELAHFERRDHWVSPIQAFLGAIFFFHPAVRYALRQLVLERELACDEQVLSMGTKPATYAEIILRVAEHSIPGRQSDCPAFNSPGKTLERRIEMILSYPSLATDRWRLPAIVRAAIVLSLASLLLPQRALTAEPPLIPPPTIRVAALQPLMQGISMAATTLTKEATAEPVQAQPAPAAQAVLPALSGTIADPSGAVVPGVTVTLIAASPEPSRTVTTDGAGRFTFPQTVEGQYTLQARLPGFSTVERKIVVRSGEPSVQNFSLPVKSIETVVNVRASRAAATPQNTNSPPPPLRVGGEVAQPNLITQVKPQYPAGARASGVQDFVQLQAIIGKDGTLVSLQVDPIRPGTGNPELVKAAMDAVQQWRYTPGMLNGMPIEIATTITVNFELD